MTTHFPIRVFLLSDGGFLRDGLARAFRNTADILLVGAQPHSVDSPLEIVESACDVLLMDSATALALYSHVPHNLRSALSNLKVITILMGSDDSVVTKITGVGAKCCALKDAAVADVLSAILTVARGETVHSPRHHVVWTPQGRVSTPSDSATPPEMRAGQRSQ